MRIVAITMKEAESFLSKHERHYKSPVEPICAIAVGDGEGPNDLPEIHGAAILGRKDWRTAELAHIYADGSSQAYSLLYGGAWRTLKALGYEQTVL